MFSPRQPPALDVRDISRACLGTGLLETIGVPGLDYAAYMNHCRSRLNEYEKAVSLPLQTAKCGEDVMDILQMIKSGLHRDELVDILEQRAGPESGNCQLVQGRISRVASLLVMTEIGMASEYGRRARVYWRSGTLRELMKNHFTRERALANKTSHLEQMPTAKSLVQIARLRIAWTADLSDHLMLDREQKVVHIFHHATYLECQRKRYEKKKLSA